MPESHAVPVCIVDDHEDEHVADVNNTRTPESTKFGGRHFTAVLHPQCAAVAGSETGYDFLIHMVAEVTMGTRLPWQ